ncbi:MAG: vanadium-dependent haloperoxidase [Bacteroidota bacterium]
MKPIIPLLCLLASLLLFSHCQQERYDYQEIDQFSTLQQVNWNKVLTKVMVADIFTPPVCSRIYVYPNIAAYEVMAGGEEIYPSFAGQLKDLEPLPLLEETSPVYRPLSAMIAFATVAKELVYGREKIEEAEEQYLNSVKALGLPSKSYESSIAYGRKVGQHILNWANSDGYLERTAKSQYVLSKEPGRWKPTPPDYMPAIEPHWNTLRTFVIDSASQFTPPPPTRFSIDQSSPFYKETLDVYETVRGLNEERRAIAKFWDCNPNISHTKGHLTFFDQKISPGGHWISIAGIAIEKSQQSAQEAARIFALTSITLADAFISCWDEKYRSSLIRPETYINEHIDPDWKPLLQTPAFPEYTSGHSVISSAAAVMLSNLLGEDFAFVDSTEVTYGLPIREYGSFYQAADEAAISRLYGGIHYRPAIEDGVQQGKDIGRFVVDRLVEKH